MNSTKLKLGVTLKKGTKLKKIDSLFERRLKKYNVPKNFVASKKTKKKIA